MLIDEDQRVPEATDTWRLKYRFYFEDFTPAAATNGSERAGHGDSHQNLFRTWWSTEATNNEYDVPQSTSDCMNKHTPERLCVHELKSQFKARDMISGSHGGGGSQCMVSGDPAACGNITLIEERDGGYFLELCCCSLPHTGVSLELWNDDTGELLCRNKPMYGNGVCRITRRVMSWLFHPACGAQGGGLLPLRDCT